MDRDPAIFVTEPSRRQQKTNLKKSLSVYYFLKVHLHHLSKIKSPKEVTKQWESRFFLQFLLIDRRIRIRVHEAQKHTDPTDPDPQHWYVPYLRTLAKRYNFLYHLSKIWPLLTHRIERAERERIEHSSSSTPSSAPLHAGYREQKPSSRGVPNGGVSAAPQIERMPRAGVRPLIIEMRRVACG
jgi:hypothetical protein